MTPTRARRRFLIATLAGTGLLVVTGLVATIASPGAFSGRGTDAWNLVLLAVPVGAFATVGAVIAARLPGNAVGPIMSAIGLSFAVVMACSGVSHWALATGALPRDVGEWIDVPSSAWVVGLGLIGTQLPLRLPDGRLPSPRWRWFSRATILLIAMSVVGMSVQPGRVEGVAGTRSPLAVEGAEPLGGVFVLVVLCFAVSVVSLLLRYRSSPPDQRAQLRWVAFGGLVFIGVYAIGLPTISAGEARYGGATTLSVVVTCVTQAAFAALPVSIGYAMRRHGLYDIDVVLNRALVYTVLTVTLVATYVVTVLVAQLVLPPRSDLGVAVSTLVAAALFAPARRRIQADVDRRFFRRRYDAQRTVQVFSARLRDQLDLDALDGELRRVVGEAVQPSHVSVWLRER